MEPIQRYKQWNTSEIRYLKENYPTRPVLEIAREMGRTRNSILYMVYNLGLKKDESQPPLPGYPKIKWRLREVAYLKANYNLKTVKEIAQDMGRSMDSINYMSQNLGLKKDPIFFKRGSKKFQEEMRGEAANV